MKTYKCLTDTCKNVQNHQPSGKFKSKPHWDTTLTPVRMAKIDKAGNDECWRECGERGSLLRCWWECKLVQPLWKTVWRFLKKWKIELPATQQCATGYLPKRYKCSDPKRHLHPNVYSSNVHNSQIMERARISINRWMDKEGVVYIYIYNGILFSHQKNEILPFAMTWMELEGIMLSEMSQSEKDKCHRISLICGT